MAGTNLNLLVALRALLEEANVTRAGQRLGVSQSAMSTTLGRLRARFGDELLIREGRDLVLTPFATDLLPELREALRLVDVAFGGGETFDPTTSTRTYTIAMSDYAMSVVHQLLLERLADRAPGVTLRVESFGPRAGAERSLLDIDALIGPLGYGFPGISRPLWRDRMVGLVDPGNPALREGRIDLADYARLPQAVASFGDRVANSVERVFAERGVEIPVQFRIAGWLPLPFVVRSTDLVAIVPERLARLHTTPLGVLTLVELPFEFPLAERYWFSPHRASSAEHRWLFAQLDEIAAELETHSSSG